jgi:hypothetical protein
MVENQIGTIPTGETLKLQHNTVTWIFLKQYQLVNKY